MREAKQAYAVLIVDDDDNEIKGVISDFLSAEGCVCQTASSGSEALDKINRAHFDALITDIRMEGIDGITLMREALKRFPDMPVMVMTGFVGPYSEKEAIEAGASDFITKPFALAEFSIRFHKMMRDHVVLAALKDEDRRKTSEIVKESTETIETLRKEIDGLKELAYFDTVTGLPNRALFVDRLNQSLELAKRYMHKLAVLFLDLDYFKDVNDSLGHDMGDLLLKEVATRLTGLIRRSDTVARMGGDEFAVVISHISREAEAEAVAQRVLKAISESFNLEGHACAIGASIGISIYPSDGLDAETLLKNADRAMYSVKEQGRNNYSFFKAQS